VRVSGGGQDGGVPSASGALLDIRDLSVEYLIPGKGPDSAVRAVDGVSFAIAPGEVFGLAGESGSGKSTIAHSILRVLRPPAIITGGAILFKGRDVLEMGEDEVGRLPHQEVATLTRQDFDPHADSLEAFRWRDVAMVFQSAMCSLNPVMKISEQIMDVLMTHQALSRSQARARAVELLEIVNIDPSRLDSYPHELSGGMRQRVVIAIALALHPPLLIMDEPTTALDVVVQKDIMKQIGRLKQQLGFSVLFITHDLSLMVEFSDRIGIMYAGQIVEMAEAKEIFNNPLHPYTQGLLSSFPPLHGARQRLTGIPGSPPNMADPPTGCRFHPRCTICQPKETAVVPQLREVQPGHWLRWHQGLPLPAGAAEAMGPGGQSGKGRS
jgi:peptide/nickel transport system ATP-binding protein